MLVLAPDSSSIVMIGVIEELRQRDDFKFGLTTLVFCLSLGFLLLSTNFSPWVRQGVETMIILPRSLLSFDLKSSKGMLGKIWLQAMLSPRLERLDWNFETAIQIAVVLVPAK